MLRSYMHGFFVDNRLYGKAAALAAPFTYAAFREAKVKEKLEAERASRIAPKKRLPRVNADLAARVLSAAGRRGAQGAAGLATVGAGEDSGDEGEATEQGPNLLEDSRFKALFEDPSFAVSSAPAPAQRPAPRRAAPPSGPTSASASASTAADSLLHSPGPHPGRLRPGATPQVDEEAPEYRMLHPNAPARGAPSTRELLKEHFEGLEGSDEDEDGAAARGAARDGGMAGAVLIEV